MLQVYWGQIIGNLGYKNCKMMIGNYMRINFHNMCNVAQSEFLNAYTYHASKRFVSNADCKERLFSFSVTHGVSCFGVI